MKTEFEFARTKKSQREEKNYRIWNGGAAGGNALQPPHHIHLITLSSPQPEREFNNPNQIPPKKKNQRKFLSSSIEEREQSTIHNPQSYNDTNEKRGNATLSLSLFSFPAFKNRNERREKEEREIKRNRNQKKGEKFEI